MLVDQPPRLLTSSLHTHNLGKWPSETTVDAGGRAIAATVCNLEGGDGMNASSTFAKWVFTEVRDDSIESQTIEAMGAISFYTPKKLKP